jgi:hypothetical protein
MQFKMLQKKNILENLSYTFSTGDSVDNEMISGKIVDAQSLSGVESIVVGLWIDSNISKKPTYYTKTDKSGYWQLKHLKSGTYPVLAFDDKNGSKMYDYGDGKVGFLHNNVSTTDSLENIIFLFSDNKKTAINSIELKDRKGVIAFNNPIQSIEINSEPNPIAEYAVLNDSRDTLLYWFKSTSDSVTLMFKTK